MEMELNNLIEKIKKDGVQEAQAKADEIVQKAEAEAEKILKSAKGERDEIIRQAQENSKQFFLASEKALKQSSRDVLLVLRERVTEFFDRIIKQEVEKQLSFEVLKTIIIKAVENFKKEGELDIEILVNEADKKKLEKTLFRELVKEAKEKITIQGSKKISNGFRIGKKGEESYIDFTDEALAEAFKRYLNPKLVEKLDISLGIKEK